ncbi:MAG: ATP synthase subunit I [Gammaproteobacteria bacterium]|nr:ATP synthase subunit I [Gammaproteobacteria bacterium]
MAGLVFSLGALVMFGSTAAGSALIGAALCVVPGLLFALRIAPGMFQDSPKLAMRGFYTGETIKLAATVVLFALVFRFVSPLRPEFLFTGFIATHFSMIFAALVTD